MPLNVTFDVKVRREPRILRYGGTLLRITLSDNTVSIVDRSRDDGVPIIVMERVYDQAGHILAIDYPAWRKYIRGEMDGVSDAEAQKARDEFSQIISKNIIPVQPERSNDLLIKKGAQVRIGLYVDGGRSGFRRFATVLSGRVKELVEVAITDYRPEIPRTFEDIKLNRLAQR